MNTNDCKSDEFLSTESDLIDVQDYIDGSMFVLRQIKDVEVKKRDSVE